MKIVNGIIFAFVLLSMICVIFLSFTNSFHEIYMYLDVMQLNYLLKFLNFRYPLNATRMFNAIKPFFTFYFPSNGFVPSYEKQHTFKLYDYYGIDGSFLKTSSAPIYISIILSGIYGILCLITISKRKKYKVYR